MLRAHFLNQGRVDAIVLECDGRFAFIDAGYRRNGVNAVEYMNTLGVYCLDYYIASHGHKNHVGGAGPIIDAFKPKVIIAPRWEVFEAITRFAKKKEHKAIGMAHFQIMENGDSIRLGGATIYCIGPNKQRDVSTGAYSENYNSLLLRVDYAGKARLLLTGDSTAAIIAKCKTAARAQTLKNPHHAGAQPASLLKQVKPESVVVCSNVKPSKAYRKRIADAGAFIYSACKGNVVLVYE